MKVQEIYINKYEYEVRLLFDITCAQLSVLNDELKKIDCSKELVDKANIEFGKCNDNVGMTYSNHALKKTLIIIGKTSSGKQFINTLIHEIYHFVEQLAIVNSVSDIEEKATFIGNFTMQLTDIINDTLKETK